MSLVILTASIVLNGFWKQSCLVATSVTSALEVIFNEMRYINLRFTYLLTYLLFLDGAVKIVHTALWPHYPKKCVQWPPESTVQ